MAMPEDSIQSLVTLNPKSLLSNLWGSLSRSVIPSAAEGSFLHCGQYHIGMGRKTTPWYYVFLLSHIHRLSVCKKDFSTSLEMTLRGADVSQLLVTSHS